MKNNFTKLLAITRKSAGLTQEQAAERLNISVRTLAWYEQGKIPSDTMVADMVRVYHSQALGYTYLSMESAVGMLLLPKIRLSGVSSGAMQFHMTMKKAEEIYREIEDICSDDEITISEEARFKQCLQVIDDLVSTALSLKMLPQKAQKKSTMVAATML